MLCRCFCFRLWAMVGAGAGGGSSEAAERGDLHAVKAELAAGANVNACNHSKWTALHRATERDHSDVRDTTSDHLPMLAVAVNAASWSVCVRHAVASVVPPTHAHGCAGGRNRLSSCCCTMAPTQTYRPPRLATRLCTSLPKKYICRRHCCCRHRRRRISLSVLCYSLHFSLCIYSPG